MAEIPMGGQSAAPIQGTSYRTLANLTGAALSLSLVVGAGVWGYKILIRDVSGVPVIRAAEGPMRIQPDDPGGLQAANQGLSVNDVAATGGAMAPADRLVLAPEPLDLIGEDAPTAAIETEVLSEAAFTTDVAKAEKAEPIVAPKPLSAGSIDSIEALAAQIAAGAEPLEEPAPVTQTVPTVDAAPKPKFGLKRSLRPQVRPVNFSQTVQTASLSAETPTSVVATAVRDVDAASVPVGTRLVQLGAFGSEEIAKAEWDKLYGRFGDYLGGKDRVIQKATSGGRVFYRLRAMGFVDLSDARRLCSALKAEGADCIPVVTR